MLQIAQRWFERKKIDSNITLLWEPHVHELLRCNIWHVRGRDCDLLIDTGVGVKSLRSEIADLIDKPLIALATHFHYDHVGCLHEFETRLMHPAEATDMANYNEFCSLAKNAFPPAFLKALDQMGMPVQGEALIDALPCADFSIENFHTKSTTVTRTIDEGDVIDLGNRHFEVIHLPGHSIGSVGLWEPSSAILFSGDAIYDGALLDELEDSNIVDYVKTMKRLRELPVSIVHGGHEPSFNRVRLVELVDAYLARRDN